MLSPIDLTRMEEAVAQDLDEVGLGGTLRDARCVQPRRLNTSNVGDLHTCATQKGTKLGASVSAGWHGLNCRSSVTSA